MAEERRIVTALFADVVGSTTLGESLDPEDLRGLLSRYHAIAKDAVAAYGGTLEKFIGDAVMAVFGLPTAHGDDEQRALGAALDIRDRVRSDARLGERLPLRIGVNSGEVIATRSVESGDFLVTGDAVNVAARLQQAADPWQILVGERTARAAGGAFSYGPAIPIAAKGKREPVRGSELLGRGRAVRIRVPLVGREDDLAQLELAARRAFSERRPYLVSIVAPAGTGKTRLLEEFLDHLPSLAPSASIAIAQCLPYGQRLTYWPLRAVLFQLIGLPAEAEPAEVRDAISRWLTDSANDKNERAVELLAATVGAGEAETADRAALLAAWRGAIEHAAADRPLVVVFEDLHWSSDSLLDLVEFVMQPRGAAPLLMLALARPELLDRRPTWGGGRRNYLSISLEPLSDDSVAKLVGHLLETSAPEIVARVVSRAEGNPFFAGELVRSLLDHVASLDDGAAVERALALLPDTVQGTVLARLDLLSPAERRTVQLGAVLGRTFRPAAIAALAPELTADLPRALDVLLDKELIRMAERDALVFRHILIREVAYQTLPRAERARLHASAARWYESSAAAHQDAYAELIAYHYREAATLAGTLEESESIPLRRAAARWLERAAEVAMSGAANVEALSHFRAAIELAEPEQRSRLHERAGDTYASGEAAEEYRLALELFRAGGGSDPDRELRLIAARLGVLTRSQGSVGNRLSDEAMAALRAEGHALLDRAHDDLAISRFLTAEGFYPFWVRAARAPTSGELDIAERGARRALAIAERLDHPMLMAAALDALGSILALRGDPAGSRELARRRILMADRLDLVERMDAYSVAAWMSVALGELDEALRLSGEGMAIVQPGQAPSWALHLAAWRAHAQYLRGDWDDCLATGQRMRQLWIDSGRISAGYATRGLFAVCRVLQGRKNSLLAQPFYDMFREILTGFSSATPAALTFEVLERRRPAEDLRALFVDRFEVTTPEAFDILLASFCDLGEVFPASELVRIERRADQGRILAGTIRRTVGLSRSDVRSLEEALAIFLRHGAEPYAARSRCELGLLTADERTYADGARSLELLGDLEQLELYERRRR